MIWPPGTARAFIQGEFYQQFFWKVIIVIGFIIIFLIVYTLVKQWKNTSVNVKRFMIPAALGVFFYCIGFPCCTAKECKEFFSSVIMCIFPNNYEVICSFIETNFLGLSGFFFLYSGWMNFMYLKKQSEDPSERDLAIFDNFPIVLLFLTIVFLIYCTA